MRRSRVGWALTGNAVAFLAVLMAMWYSGSSQQNGAAYLLFFALASLGIVSIPQAFSNVRGLTARAESIKPSFAGQEATLPVQLSNSSRATRRGVRVKLPNSRDNYDRIDELPAGKAARASVRFPTSMRGEHELQSVDLESSYPLGLLRITKRLHVGQRYIVYPKPDGDSNLPRLNSSRARDGHHNNRADGDDFAGVRAYVPGESQRHIDWKAVARGQAMMTKQFTNETDYGPLYLDYSAAGSGDMENRLSQLALWIIEAERLRRPYGLRLLSIEISPSLGQMHFHRCLRALALF